MRVCSISGRRLRVWASKLLGRRLSCRLIFGLMSLIGRLCRPRFRLIKVGFQIRLWRLVGLMIMRVRRGRCRVMLEP